MLTNLKAIKNKNILKIIYKICEANKNSDTGINIAYSYEDYVYIFEDLTNDNNFLNKEKIKIILNCIYIRKKGWFKEEIILKDPVTGEDV